MYIYEKKMRYVWCCGEEIARFIFMFSLYLNNYYTTGCRRLLRLLLALAVLLLLWANNRLRASTLVLLDAVVVGLCSGETPSDVTGDCKLLLPDILGDCTTLLPRVLGFCTLDLLDRVGEMGVFVSTAVRVEACVFFPLARIFFAFLLRARISARLPLALPGTCGSLTAAGLGVAVLTVCVSLPIEVTTGACVLVPSCSLRVWVFLPLVRKSRAVLPR